VAVVDELERGRVLPLDQRHQVFVCESVKDVCIQGDSLRQFGGCPYIREQRNGGSA
jgi:hypothetical protein